MPPLVRDVLCHLRQELQRIKHLKIARHPFAEPLIPGIGKPRTPQPLQGSKSPRLLMMLGRLQQKRLDHRSIKSYI